MEVTSEEFIKRTCMDFAFRVWHLAFYNKPVAEQNLSGRVRTGVS